jgi:hypothetical protein
MMDIAELQEFEVTEFRRTGGDGACCIANGTLHVSINATFIED